MRMPTDKCLICQSNDASKSGSHLMPAGLSAPCDNGRGKEEVYFIGDTVDIFYGSANSRNNNFIQDTRKHINFNVMDYVFCPQCEDNLAVIESAIIPFLNKIVPSKQGFKREDKTTSGLLFREYTNVDLAQLKLFFYTVVWRLSISQELNYGVKVLSEEQNERLRSTINKFLSHDLNKITGNKELLEEMPLTILTSSFSDPTKNFYSPHRINNNPPLFSACCYLIFIHFNEYIILNPNLDLPLSVFDRLLVNKNKQPLKIGFLTNEEWESFLSHEYLYRANNFIKIRVAKLMEVTNKSYTECRRMIHSRAFELQVEQLMLKLDKSKEECIKLYTEHGETIIVENYLKQYGFSFHQAFMELFIRFS